MPSDQSRLNDWWWNDLMKWLDQMTVDEMTSLNDCR